jgi:hypothetical protein
MSSTLGHGSRSAPCAPDAAVALARTGGLEIGQTTSTRSKTARDVPICSLPGCGRHRSDWGICSTTWRIASSTASGWV